MAGYVPRILDTSFTEDDAELIQEIDRAVWLHEHGASMPTPQRRIIQHTKRLLNDKYQQCSPYITEK